MPNKPRNSNKFIRRHLALGGAGILCCLSLAACVSTPPSSLTNVCDIFTEKRSWYKEAKKSSEKWNSPIPVMMAFLHQESRFVANARPPRKKILWIFPGPRASSAYGYSQAKDATWEWYIDASGNRGADRDDFADAIDFVGWYNSLSRQRNQIPASDSYHLYLAYHEGHGGYTRQTFRDKAWLLDVAGKVKSLSQRYHQQLTGCEEDLQSPWWWPF